MKIVKPTHKKSMIIIALIIITVVIGAGVYAYTQRNSDKPNEVTSQVENKEARLDPEVEKQADESISTEKSSKTPVSSSNKDDQVNPQPSTTSLTITAANQNGSTLQIRTLISELWSSGQCSLTLTKGSLKIIRQAKIQALSSESTCQGFDILTSELESGTWNIAIIASNGNKNTSTTKEVTIK